MMNVFDAISWALLIVASLAIIAVILGTIASACGLFERKPNKQKIHWNAKEGQIMTKAGECLWDKRKHDQDRKGTEACREGSFKETRDTSERMTHGT